MGSRLGSLGVPRRAVETASAPLRRAVLRYVASALVAVIAVGIGALAVLRRVAEDEAVRQARSQNDTLAVGVVTPALREPLVRSEPAEVARFDAVFRERIAPTGVRRVKLWDASGTIVYSDEARLIGRRFPLGAAERVVLDQGGSQAGPSDLDEPENVYEARDAQLIEVYRRVTTPEGTPLLFETYVRASDVSSLGSRISRSFAPIALGALVLLALIQLPLAWILVRRIRTAQRDQEALLRSAVEASQLERKRIAQDLHDGVVQDLAGVSYTIAAALDSLGGTAPASTVHALEDAAASTRTGIRQLRTLLVELYPPNLQQAGLHAALCDLLDRCKAQGVETSLRFEPADLAPDTEALVYRTAQEALRNVVHHAGAGHVEVTVTPRDDGTASMTVRDDGCGFDPSQLGRPEPGHVGLPLMIDLARHSGAHLEVKSSPGAGTVLDLRVPLRRIGPPSTAAADPQVLP